MKYILIAILISGCSTVKTIEEPKSEVQIASIRKGCKVFKVPVKSKENLFEYLTTGEQLRMIKQSNGWTKISLDQFDGYIESDCI